MQGIVNTEEEDISSLMEYGEDIITKTKALPSSREVSSAITKFEEGIMWLDRLLKKKKKE